MVLAGRRLSPWLDNFVVGVARLFKVGKCVQVRCRKDKVDTVPQQKLNELNTHNSKCKLDSSPHTCNGGILHDGECLQTGYQRRCCGREPALLQDVGIVDEHKPKLV